MCGNLFPNTNICKGLLLCYCYFYSPNIVQGNFDEELIRDTKSGHFADNNKKIKWERPSLVTILQVLTINNFYLVAVGRICNIKSKEYYKRFCQKQQQHHT